MDKRRILEKNGESFSERMFVYLRITKGRVLLGSEAEKTVRMKHSHEIRDPIHVFIRLDSGEREVLVVTDPNNLSNEIKSLLPEIALEESRRYWRRVIRNQNSA